MGTYILILAYTFHLSMTISTIDELLPVTLLVGFAYGSIWTLTPVLVGLFFGHRNFEHNWGWMTVVPAFGGYFFSTIFGGVYDSACVEHECFRPACEVAMYGSVLSVIASVLLWWIRR